MSQIVINGNNLDALKKYPDNYFDAVVTDPPYGLGKEPNAEEVMKGWIEKGYHEVGGSGFMGKEWDAFVPQPIFWQEVFRVLKHGGHVVSFFGTRTYDWGVMAMRFAGFEVRDCIQWLYGSGFPKSHNISKAIDKLYGAEREVVAILPKGSAPLKNGHTEIKGGGFIGDERSPELKITNSATEEAKQWDGWGSALKPANEPIVLARKPIEKGLSIAENVLKWGTGGINIDGSRIGTSDEISNHSRGSDSAISKGKYGDSKEQETHQTEGQKLGRFPANLILTHHPECECKGIKKVKGSSCQIDDIGKGKNESYNNGIYSDKKGIITISYNDENGEETVEDWECHPDCPIKIMDEQSGVLKSGAMDSITKGGKFNVYGKMTERTVVNPPSEGGASRFFYCAKASKSERNKGLEGFEEKVNPDNYIMPKLTCSECGSKRVDSSNKLVCGCNGKTHYEEQNSLDSKNNFVGGNKNFHPTVKPVKLMQYLVNLITPPNGKVLDPFCGSGTTGIACKLEGFEFVGMEQDPEYAKIAESRIKNWTKEKQKVKKTPNKKPQKKVPPKFTQGHLF
jgi:site-specific DNA-methyltransferase (adenine-specific)